MTQIFCLVTEQDAQNNDAIDQEHVSPKVDLIIYWVVQLVYQDQLDQEDEKHAVELDRWVKFPVLQDVPENYDFVQKN